MGRYSGSGRATTSGYLFLDVRYLQRKGFLHPGTSSSQRWSRRGEPIGSINLQAWDGHVALSYRTRKQDSEEWTSKEYPVSLEWTQCNYGGERAWFRCPATNAGDVWRSCTVVPCSLAGVVTISHMTARAKRVTVGCC